MSEPEDRTVGRYRLLEEIGQGGMSVVYRGVDPGTGESVAIKVLSAYIAQEPRFKARFEREVKLLRQMDHPHIVPILNYGEEHGKTYIVMPYYGGGTLQDLIEGEGLGLRQVGQVLADVASGLEHAHRGGIVHRDIKPSNIVLDDQGRALISDFGFAHVSDSSHSLTGSVLIGTPAFMSPEQCSGDEVDARSDQYSLGAVLYQATTGKLPYEADTPMAMVLKHINDPLTRPRYINPHLPDVVEVVIERAMAKDPSTRFESMDDLSQAFSVALAESLDSETGLPKPESIGPAPVTQVVAPPKPSIWGPRRTLVAVALLVMIAFPVAGLSFSGALSGGAEARNRTPTPSEFLLATIEALSTANAERLEGSQEPGAVETAVAATIEAMGLFDTLQATPSLEAASATPTPTATPSAVPVVGGGGSPPPPPPPPPGPPPPGATATPTPTDSGPTSTPVPPTATSAGPTDTSGPPPTTDPSMCKGPDHPVFPCTPTPTPEG